MNQQISELVLKAGVPSLWTVGMDQQGNQILEKFAELIVNECARIAFKLAPSDESACDISQAIEQHFGVDK